MQDADKHSDVQTVCQTDSTVVEKKSTKKPNELFGVYYSERIKIHDPNTGEILLQTRCA